jgi:DNA-binding transcriptional ArsR family regulator
MHLYFLSMDLTDPTRAVTATLDGPVLAALARSGRPLTVGEVAAQTPRGSEIGVRRSLARLVEQGIVSAAEMGRNRVHELNREHVAAPVAALLAGLRLELWDRLRRKLGTWNPKPVYGCVFGSAARGDGDAQSDIDLLLVHPPFPGEIDPRCKGVGLGKAIPGDASEFMATPLTERQATRWSHQAEQLHGLVRTWTGNPLQLVDMSSYEWADHRRRDTTLFADIHRDAVDVVAAPSWMASVRAESR